MKKKVNEKTSFENSSLKFLEAYLTCNCLECRTLRVFACIQVVPDLYKHPPTHFSPYIYFVGTDFVMHTIFMSNKINSKVGNLKKNASQNPTISQNDKCVSIVHKHNAYRNFI